MTQEKVMEKASRVIEGAPGSREIESVGIGDNGQTLVIGRKCPSNPIFLVLFYEDTLGVYKCQVVYTRNRLRIDNKTNCLKTQIYK